MNFDGDFEGDDPQAKMAWLWSAIEIVIKDSLMSSWQWNFLFFKSCYWMLSESLKTYHDNEIEDQLYHFHNMKL